MSNAVELFTDKEVSEEIRTMIAQLNVAVRNAAVQRNMRIRLVTGKGTAVGTMADFDQVRADIVKVL